MLRRGHGGVNIVTWENQTFNTSGWRLTLETKIIKENFWQKLSIFRPKMYWHYLCRYFFKSIDNTFIDTEKVSSIKYRYYLLPRYNQPWYNRHRTDSIFQFRFLNTSLQPFSSYSDFQSILRFIMFNIELIDLFRIMFSRQLSVNISYFFTVKKAISISCCSYF